MVSIITSVPTDHYNRPAQSLDVDSAAVRQAMLGLDEQKQFGAVYGLHFLCSNDGRHRMSSLTLFSLSAVQGRRFPGKSQRWRLNRRRLISRRSSRVAGQFGGHLCAKRTNIPERLFRYSRHATFYGKRKPTSFRARESVLSKWKKVER